ncbi:hypothetical protein Holit_00980 [Hollandina sp. SP2]
MKSTLLVVFKQELFENFSFQTTLLYTIVMSYLLSIVWVLPQWLTKKQPFMPSFSAKYGSTVPRASLLKYASIPGTKKHTQPIGLNYSLHLIPVRPISFPWNKTTFSEIQGSFKSKKYHHHRYYKG